MFLVSIKQPKTAQKHKTATIQICHLEHMLCCIKNTAFPMVSDEPECKLQQLLAVDRLLRCSWRHAESLSEPIDKSGGGISG